MRLRRKMRYWLYAGALLVLAIGLTVIGELCHVWGLVGDGWVASGAFGFLGGMVYALGGNRRNSP